MKNAIRAVRIADHCDPTAVLIEKMVALFAEYDSYIRTKKW